MWVATSSLGRPAIAGVYPLPDTGSRDCADEENGAVEVTPTQRDRMK